MKEAETAVLKNTQCADKSNLQKYLSYRNVQIIEITKLQKYPSKLTSINITEISNVQKYLPK